MDRPYRSHDRGHKEISSEDDSTPTPRRRQAQNPTAARSAHQCTLTSAGLERRALADIVVAKSKGEPSKPSPDLLIDALEQLGLSGDQCLMVGDTVYDGEACRRAGVAFLGVLSGGTAESALLESGARAVWQDVAALLADLDRAVELASFDAATHQ